MSQNDGGETIKLSRDPAPRPVIPRGVMKVPIDPIEGPLALKPGDRVSFAKRLTNGNGRNFVAVYHDALILNLMLFGEMEVEVGPDVAVTWEMV